MKEAVESELCFRSKVLFSSRIRLTGEREPQEGPGEELTYYPNIQITDKGASKSKRRIMISQILDR